MQDIVAGSTAPDCPDGTSKSHGRLDKHPFRSSSKQSQNLDRQFPPTQVHHIPWMRWYHVKGPFILFLQVYSVASVVLPAYT